MKAPAHIIDARKQAEVEAQKEGNYEQKQEIIEVRPRAETEQNKQQLPNERLLERLAKGHKAPIDKKAYKKLTSKNYNQLPEVQYKVDEE